MQTDSTLPVDGQVKVSVASNNMEAYLMVSGPVNNGNPATYEQAMAALNDAGVMAGIKYDRVRDALAPDNWNKSILVAEGTPAQDGVDGRIEYKIKLADKETRPVEMEDGRVDYRNLNLFQNVVRGQLLAVRIPPQPGVPGVTVKGTPISPKPGKNVLLPRGKNTVADDSGNQLFATIDGHVVFSDNKLSVTNVMEFKGDIDLSTGNIDYVGSISVRGNITTGFVVRTSGDLEVNGIIEGATVDIGGNILVKSGIVGGNKALVKAGGFIMAKYIENARVEAGGDIIISDAIVQSTVRSGGSIKVEGRKGTIVGGVLQAAEEISARTVGSYLSPQTILEVGINPRLREEYKNITHSYLDKKKILENVSQQLQTYQKSVVSLDRLPEKRKLVMIKLLEEYKQLREELQALEERKKFLDEETNRIQKGRVRVYDMVYPGVQITIVNSVYSVNDPMRMVMFALDQGDVRALPLKF